jgi:hypothetical protein
LSSVRIYLDTNHWIGLRQAHRGKGNNPNYLRLLQLLRQLTEARIATIPVSDQLITELCHQADLNARRITATIIDELSDGVTLVGFYRRSEVEMIEWTNASRRGGSSLPLLTVWTGLPSALSSYELPLDGIDPLSAAFAKAAEDISDELRLYALPSLDALTFDAADGQAFALRLTANKESGSHRVRRFQEVFQQEADEYFTTMIPRMPWEVIAELEKLVDDQKAPGADLASRVRAVFWMQHRTGSHPQSLPGLRIIAGCASRIIAEPGRRFKDGDQGDIFHACAALPYCDVFLTDAATRHLVTTSPNNLASLYGCTVLADPGEAVDHLQRLVA